jgi:succinyl-diaminopimelate desuccinylase
MNEAEEAVLSRIDEREPAGFLGELIRTPSPAPPGDCREVSEVCSAKLQEAGLSVQVLAAEEAMPNVVATLKGEELRPLLIFDAHMDSVPVEDASQWVHEPFSGELVDGAIYGRGAGDDKGSVAAQIAAAQAITEAGVRLKGTLLVCAVADEEQGGPRGTKWLRDKGYLRPDSLVIGQQTDNHVAAAERSMCRFEVVVRGKGAYVAMPWDGVNAIVKMARLICFLQNALGPRLEARVHSHSPPPL